MKREKRLTKKERKSQDARPLASSPAAAHQHGQPQQHQHAHIHCIACGKHLDPEQFGEASGAEFYRCQHGTDFPHCVGCADKAKQLVDEHDRTGRPVQKTSAWH